MIFFFATFPADPSDLRSTKKETLENIGSEEVVRSLTERTELTDPRLMRGIPLEEVLANMGDILMPTGGIGGGASVDTFACSQEVDSLDFFISHSWRDSGRFKWLLLLWEMNFRVAFLLSNVGGAAICAIGAAICFQLYPNDLEKVSIFAIAMVVRIVVIMSFLLLLLFGHHVTGKNPMFFLDKACINQTDPVLKEMGIKNIGGFLRRSNCMLVTWGSDYFSRLWCCYELSLYIK